MDIFLTEDEKTGNNRIGLHKDTGNTVEAARKQRIRFKEKEKKTSSYIKP